MFLPPTKVDDTSPEFKLQMSTGKCNFRSDSISGFDNLFRFDKVLSNTNLRNIIIAVLIIVNIRLDLLIYGG